MFIPYVKSQDKLVSPYHGSSAELVLIGVEQGNLAIPSWCYYPLYHRATVGRLYVSRVLYIQWALHLTRNSLTRQSS